MHKIFFRKQMSFVNCSVNLQVKEGDLPALDEMLYKLMAIYSKLRQVPKLITKILGTLCVSDWNTDLPITPRFLKW